MRVRRTGSSRFRELTGCSKSARNWHRGVRTTPVAWNAVGGGSKPPPGWGFSRACACTPKRSSLRHQRAFRQAEDRARDDKALDLARPLVDLRDLRVAVVPLDRELLGVAVPAEDLDRFARLAACHLRGVELRLR